DVGRRDGGGRGRGGRGRPGGALAGARGTVERKRGTRGSTQGEGKEPTPAARAAKMPTPAAGSELRTALTTAPRLPSGRCRPGPDGIRRPAPGASSTPAARRDGCGQRTFC